MHQEQKKDSWFFDIYEDTPEELATNLMEHSTCTLDISSDEETSARLKDDRGKENVPPLDDVSQTRATGEVETAEPSMVDLKSRTRKRRELDACDIDRNPLGEMNAEEFYAEGCDEESVFIIATESEVVEETEAAGEVGETVPLTFDFIAEVKGKRNEIDVDSLMAKDDFVVAPKASLLGPIEKAEEGFTIYESGSERGD